MPMTGHVQLAQVPGRNEPNSNGELNFKYILNVVQQAGYKSWVGCEYKPLTGVTFDGLKWIQEYGYKL